MTIRTLILSGGGGRGAFHAGVYKYLAENNKAGVDSEHQGVWSPDVIVGTSIGAVNGAAITQGVSAAELEQFWLKLREHDVQGLPPGMRGMTRFLLNWFFKRTIGVKLPQVPRALSTSPNATEVWPPLPLLPNWMADKLIGRWNNLIDTGPLLQTLTSKLGLDEHKIAASAKLLLIEATNIRTGEKVGFCNHPMAVPSHLNIKQGVTLQQILASCSIPLVYPWTKDSDGSLYWDGAVVANTPLGDAVDVVRERDVAEPMEAIVVLMTPWWESGTTPPMSRQGLPGNFGEAITWTLDWALLASFRVSLELIRLNNHIAQEERIRGITDGHHRVVNVVIVAPDDFLPVTRIIDYDEPASRTLIEMGYQAAQRSFQTQFPREK